MKPRWLTRDLGAWQSRGRKPCMVLTGARQVGKTTLALGLADDGWASLALDDPVLRSDIARMSADAFARRFPRAVLDEVQKLPQLLDTVKAIVDRGGPERYLLLGSSQLMLLERVRESLVGRTQLRQLWPLGLAEAAREVETVAGAPAPPPMLMRVLEESDGALRDAPESMLLHPRGAELAAAWERLLEVGGMPGLWEAELQHRDAREDLETYVTLFLERDLADLTRLHDLDPFVRLQHLAAERTATVVNASDLARDAGMSHATAARYLRFLELSFQVLLLPPWFANATKRLSRSPRLHWLDVGVWRAVTRRWEALSGEAFESAVVAEVVKALRSFRSDWMPYHLRTYDGREVDLLLVRNGECVAVEVKAGDRVHPMDARHLRGVEEITGLRCKLELVVYNGRELGQLGERTWAVPAAMLVGEAGSAPLAPVRGEE